MDTEYNDNSYMEYLNRPLNFSMYLAHTCISEAESYLVNFKSNTPDYDDTSPKVLKQSTTIISKSLAHIIKLTLMTGNFPDELKKAKVISIVKSGDKYNINNCRPISILPSFSKIFEKK